MASHPQLVLRQARISVLALSALKSNLAQDMTAAISIIDERFATAAVECLPARGSMAATLLGPFGEFFRGMELGETTVEEGAGVSAASQNLEKVSGVTVLQCPMPCLPDGVHL
jgi:hypothetical protein